MTVKEVALLCKNQIDLIWVRTQSGKTITYGKKDCVTPKNRIDYSLVEGYQVEYFELMKCGHNINGPIFSINIIVEKKQ